ncbi:MAG: hypothetical protein FWC95_03030 [Defluviitaleaceae bacterium]|nr:hypothetical protein [Defluviitaleaceae bacterium]
MITNLGMEQETRKNLWSQYAAEAKAEPNFAAASDEERRKIRQNMMRRVQFLGANAGAVSHGDVMMRFTFAINGLPGRGGYPVYIAMHGGGQGHPIMNETQFAGMSRRYRDSVDNGIYISVRGVRDTWHTHFNPESYPCYDKLIEALVLNHNADPNRVYLLGYSAGGDGVYGITPLMPDRFAAVNMSAGHHNNISAVNFMNTPILLQCGDKDTPFNRNHETVKYGQKIKELRGKYPGYVSETYIHVDKEHSHVVDHSDKRVLQKIYKDAVAWYENEALEHETIEANTNAMDWMNRYVRNPIPAVLAWDLSARAEMRENDCYYWLRAGKEQRSGILRASYNGETNTINIATEEFAGKFTVLLNYDMLDLCKEIKVNVNGIEWAHTVAPSEEIMAKTLKERGDVNFCFSAEIEIEV